VPGRVLPCSVRPVAPGASAPQPRPGAARPAPPGRRARRGRAGPHPRCDVAPGPL